MTGGMNRPKDSEDNNGSTSEIVRIAYRQSREISGSDKPEDSKNSQNDGFVCTRRLTSLPIIASINSSISEAYTNVKESHSSVEMIFEKMEEGFSDGAKMASSATSKIGQSLEKPLKSLDSVICDGLDYLEDNVPSVKLPPAEMYKNLEGFARDVSETVRKHSMEICTNVKEKFDQLSKVVEGETEKSKNTTEEQQKSNDSEDSTRS